MKINFRIQIVLRIVSFLTLIVFIYLLSFNLAQSIERTDFPAYFHAAKIILDKQIQNRHVYDAIDFEKTSSIENFNGDLYYIYSIAAAYLLSPFGFLSYFQAKALFITLNILAYFLSIALLLKALGCGLEWRQFILASLCLWMPFLNNIAGSQANPIIFFFLVLATYLLKKGHFGFCGGLIALAALFKLSPLILAGIVGMRFRRVIFVCLLVFLASFLIPGATDWIEALKTLPSKTVVVGYTPAYSMFMALGPAWFVLYALALFCITTLVAMRVPVGDSTWFIAVGQVIAFLIMPVVEYHHLILLAIPVLYLGFSRQRVAWIFCRSALIVVPVVLINLVVFLPMNFPLSYLATLYLWIVLLLSKVLRRMPAKAAAPKEA